jgi:hypothetical protein
MRYLLDAGRPAQLAAILALVVAVAVLVRRGAARSRRAEPGVGPGMLAALVGVAITAAVAVAVLGGVRSFDAVSARFGSPAVPLTADGMIVACTALRLARGWRLPGSLLVTYLFIAGTVWLNIDAATSGTDKIAHALAPVSYAVLVEMLAHLLRLHLRLAESSTARITVLTWATSPVVSTRVWLHLARTGGADPVTARALVQQVVRMGSRLRAVCPGGRVLGPPRSARAAALQTIRDGLLTAADLAALLPAGGATLSPGELLALVDSAALRVAPLTSAGQQPGVPVPVSATAMGGVPVSSRPDVPVHPEPPVPVPIAEPVSADTPAPSGRAGRSDAELLAVLAGRSGPVGVRAAARELGCGVNRARRLLDRAGLLASPPDSAGVPFGPAAPSGRSEPPDPADDEPSTGDQQALYLVPTISRPRTEP